MIKLSFIKNIKPSLLHLLKNTSVSAFIFICTGFIITLFLFYVMAELISKEPQLKKNRSSDLLVNFIRVKPKSFLDTKKRQLPKKKIKQSKPPKIKMLSSALERPPQTLISMNFPDIKSVLRSKGPAVGGPGGGSVDTGPAPLVRIEPQYPRKAARQGIEGWVILKFNVTPSGSVSDIKILNAKPPRIFNRAAIQALKKWKYRPKMENGKNLWQRGLKVQLDFKLE